ncbi:MAG: HNH endonuclease [Candidatus Auribacter fodinae]|uniref:HNH endonuclease n=1 Tax=Candidatus Auribacter fodinae TaxID=2093366 RepID=A0A3A4QQL0_9BACT|nr:MAG: HNH endonuclease [Candidatus Auribacter fodinae]
MSNAWGIPEWLEREVRERDKFCVYCGVELLESVPRGCSRKNVATWEHIINDAGIITRENIALCCSSCNSSKGTKILSDWLNSQYCKNNGIDKETVAPIIQKQF